MITNKIVEVLTGIFLIISLPVKMITTLILGILVSVTFGLLLIPISLIWICIFWGPLIGASYLYEKTPILRIPISLIGIPIAVIGYEFSSMIPSMGEKESKASKLLMCSCFPYTWHCFKFSLANYPIHHSNGFQNLLKILGKVTAKDRDSWQYVYKLKENYKF